MTYALRVLLIGFAAITFIYVIGKVRKSQIRLMVGFSWLLISAFILCIAIFPQIIFFFCALFGIQSPAHLVFLIIIFILFMQLFWTSLKLSRTQSRLEALAQEVALRDRSFLGLTTKDDALVAKQEKNRKQCRDKGQEDICSENEN